MFAISGETQYNTKEVLRGHNIMGLTVGATTIDKHSRIITA